MSMPVHPALFVLAVACAPDKPACGPEQLMPVEERYATAVAEACSEYELLADCPAYEAITKAFAAEQKAVCE